MSHPIAFSLALLLSLGWGAVVAAAAADSDAPDTVGAIRYRAPADWKPVEQPGRDVRVYVAPDSTPAEQAVIMVAMGEEKRVEDFRGEFDAVVKKALMNQKVLSAGEVVEGRSRQGYPVLSQTVSAQGADGQTVQGRFIAANVDGRLAILCYIASLPNAYEKHRPGLDDLLASVSFSAPAPTAPAEAAAAADPAAQAAAAAKAVKEWARDANRRRKPHTVLGQVMNSQGQPIKGAKGTIYLGGTTLRGDRTSFTLDVDENGHFELAVPDGVYRLTPTLTVDYDGQQLPVQLVPLDGKDPGQSFGSADGIVRDYRWQLLGLKAGLKPGSYVNFYGGHITLEDGSPGSWGHLLKDRYAPGTKLRLTLAPTAPLIDGSEAKPMQLEVDVAVLATAARDGITTVPIGVYKATAELIGANGGTKRLQLTSDPRTVRPADALEVHFVKDGYLDDVKTITLWVRDTP